jgi:hypothetical protein
MCFDGFYFDNGERVIVGVAQVHDRCAGVA